MIDVNETPALSSQDPLEQVRAVATALIARDLAGHRVRLARSWGALSLVMAHLSTFEPERLGTRPIVLRRQDINALRKQVFPTERHQLSTSSAARMGALAWLLHRLNEEGVLSVPPIRIPLHRARDLAVRLTEEAFRDAALLSSRLPLAVRRMLEGGPRTRDDADLALRVVVALIWEGPVLFPDAAPLLCGLRVGDYDWEQGFLRLRPGSRRPQQRATRAGADPARCPLRVFLRPFARVILNWYLIGRARSGGLNLADPDALLFAPLAAMGAGDRRERLNRRLAEALADMVGEKRSMTPRRLFEAARFRALETFPPILVAALSGRLRYAPTPEVALKQLEDPAAHPVPELAETAPAPPVAAETAGDATPVGAEEREPSPWDPVAKLIYEEAVAGVRAIERQLERPEVEYPRKQVCADAKRVLADLQESLQVLSGDVPPLLANLRLALRWVVWQLEHPRGTPALRVRSARGSVRIRLQRVRRILEAFLPDREVIDLDEEGWMELTLDGMAPRPTPNAKKSVRDSVKAFHRYLCVYESSPARSVHPVDWSDRDLAVAAELSEYPLPLPWAIETVRDSFRSLADPDLGEVLDIFTMLEADAGLRRSEAAGLQLADVHVGLETVIVVRASKTRSGRGRPVPLHLLLARTDLERFKAFHAKRLRETGGDLTRPLLATRRHPDGLGGKALAERVSPALKAATAQAVTPHGLRHTFASLFPLRWFAAFHGLEASRPLGELLKTPLFSRRALARFRKLFVPAGWHGRPITTQPFLVLTILMGHAGPELTVNVYVHTMDWLQRLYVEREIVLGREPRLSVKEAARATGRSLQAVYTWVPAFDVTRAGARRGNTRATPASRTRHMAREEAAAGGRLGVPSSVVVQKQVKRLSRLRAPAAAPKESSGSGSEVERTPPESR